MRRIKVVRDTAKTMFCSGCGTEFCGLYGQVWTRRRTLPVPEAIQERADAEGAAVTFMVGPKVCSLACLKEVQRTWPRHPDADGMWDRRVQYEENGQVNPYGKWYDGDFVFFGTWKSSLPTTPQR